MAINKDSKAYQGLLGKGYTDEQIMNMYDSVSNGENAKDVVANTQAENVVTVGPQNANLNYFQYGDDSNPAQQGQKGGMNEKYTGEGVKTSNLEYDENIKTSDLDPNYLYGEAAKNRNSKEAGYIARRNDMIASALYNEGLTSKEDVANFLSSQNEWMNSTEADRANTIESVWKRLGEMQPKEEEKADISTMKEALDKDTSGKLYGKTTADEGEPTKGINTVEDANSVYKIMEAGRIATVEDMLNLGVDNLAAMQYTGSNVYSDQAWRDFKKYYPEMASQVEQKVKEMRVQDNVNAISNGSELPSNNNTVGTVNNEIADFSNANANGTTSSAEITQNINTMLDNNGTAQSAQELMGTLEGEMATLKNRLRNLRTEATNAFKGDVPNYVVNAYMNNRTQEIQNQLSILEDRYNAAYQRYSTEVSNAQWQQEFDLKKEELQLQKDELALKDYQIKNGLSTDNVITSGTSATNPGDSYAVTTLSDEEVANAVNNLLTMYDNGQLGNAQCATGIQRYYLPKLGITLSNLSSWENKKKLINEDDSYVPKKGDLIIIDSGAKLEDGSLAGHIGIVIGVTSDGYVQYMDWNGSLDKNGKGTEKVAINGVKLGSNKIAGFRNINKNQSNNATSTKWTDYDYEQFEKFRDATTESLRKSIANGYGMNVSTFNKVARDALANKSEENNSSTELGYDKELGYNPYDKEIYEQIISDKMTLEDGAKKTGVSEKEMRNRVLNFQAARASGVDVYDDGSRNIDDKYGFNLDKKMVYQTIANMGGKIPGTQKDTILKELGLNPKDPKALDKALDETAKWQERQKQELDSQALDSLRAVEYIIMQDATRPQRLLAVNGGDKDTWYGALDILGGLDRGLSGEAASWDNSYKYIRDKLTLDYLVDLKNRGATFGALSNQELEAIGNAASLVMYNDQTDRFRYNVNNLYNELRKSLGYGELSDSQLDKMWNAEDSLNFDNYITITKDLKSKKGEQNIKPTRDAGQDISNRWGDNDGGNGGEILNDILQ